MFLLASDDFLNHCPRKPLVICQPRSKFDKQCVPYYLIQHRKGGQFSKKGLGWNYGTDVKKSQETKCLIQHIKEILKKNRKTVTPIVDTEKLCVFDTKKLCVSKYSIERSQRQHKKSPRSKKKGLTNSGIFVEILQNRVKEGDKNLQLQNASWSIVSV